MNDEPPLSVSQSVTSVGYGGIFTGPVSHVSLSTTSYSNTTTKTPKIMILLMQVSTM